MKDTQLQIKLPGVPPAKQGREVPEQWGWTEASVWNERMLATLERGIKGGKWFSPIDKVWKTENLQSAASMRKHSLLWCILLATLIAFVASTRAETIPTIKWQESFGGSGSDSIVASIETPDGGFILGGYVEVGVSTSLHELATDYYLVKLDAAGNKQWEKFYGGDGEDILVSLVQTSDAGYLLAGYSTSGVSGHKSNPNVGSTDLWILKLDANFNKQWDRSFGGVNADRLVCAQRTSDGGYVLGGWNLNGNLLDYWVIKLNSNGKTQWNKRYGGDSSDQLHSLKQTFDGGYILVGLSASGISGNKTSPKLGEGWDAWVVKIDSQGNMEWDQTYGGSSYEVFDSVDQTPEGGFIFAGREVPVPSSELTDYWVVKTDKRGGIQWEKRYQQFYQDIMDHFGKTVDIQKTVDGGYILSGLMTPPEVFSWNYSHDWLLLKLDKNGNKRWEKVFGADEDDFLASLHQTSDGSFMLCGSSQSGISGDKTSPNRGSWDGWVLKLESRFFIDTTATALSAGGVQLDPPQPIDGYEHGTSVTLTATPTGTNLFFGWSGAANSTSNQISVTVNHDIALTAHFSDSLLLWQHSDGRLSTWFMEDTNRIGAVVLNDGRKLPNWKLVAANHFNDDDSKDLLFQDAEGRLAVRYMDGNHLSTNVVPPAQVIGTSDLRAVGAGDFNSDSRTDILFKNSSNQLAVRLMNGSTNFVFYLLLNHGKPVGADWRVVTVCDFDSDGHPDILFQNRDGRIAVWFMNGVVKHSAALIKRNNAVAKIGSMWRLVSATRINSDDQSDLLFQHVDGRIAVWFMDGINHSSSASLNNGRPVHWRLQAVK